MKVGMTVGFLGLLLLPAVSFSQVAQTSRQVEHSKLFQNYGVKGQKLTEGQWQGGFGVEAFIPLHTTLPSRRVIFSKAACQSDAVILAKVVGQTSLLSPDETFIFTDAEFSIIEVLKHNPASHLYPGQTVTVTRPGGSVDWKGRRLTVRMDFFRDFLTQHEYLLFLKFLPTTQDYEASGSRTFEVRNGTILNLTKELLWHGQTASAQDRNVGQDPDAAAVLADARASVAAPCN